MRVCTYSTQLVELLTIDHVIFADRLFYKFAKFRIGLWCSNTNFVFTNLRQYIVGARTYLSSRFTTRSKTSYITRGM